MTSARDDRDNGARFRIERDALGEVAVPLDVLYGAETQRAVVNFPISGQRMPIRLIRALLLIKRSAARANETLGTVDSAAARAIDTACEALLADADLLRHFPVDVFQTGSGTSTHMNVNEVVGRLAGLGLGRDVEVHDEVNRGQSSNDVMPTAIHVSAAIALSEGLLPALRHLGDAIADKAVRTPGCVKMGRTHLMDAMPVRLDQVLSGWAYQIDLDVERLEQSLEQLLYVALGGTAVGTGVNAHPGFASQCCTHLAELTGLAFRPSGNSFALMGGQDAAVSLSGQLKTTAVTLMKIANDLRWMSSGPLGGLNEIELEALQPGSSIMPAKVNPVIPEAAAMVAAQVMGNDVAVTVAGQSGNFELNVMLPLIARNVLESLELLASVSRLVADKAIRGFRVNERRLRDAVARTPLLATALSPVIGHQAATTIARRAWESQRPVLEVALELTNLTRAQLERLLDPLRLTQAKEDESAASALLAPQPLRESDRAP